MADYKLDPINQRPRQGRPSAIYRTILVDFLARPDSKSCVVVPGKSHLAVTEGLRVAKKNSMLFDPIEIERAGEDVYLSKDEDYWRSNRHRE